MKGGAPLAVEYDGLLARLGDGEEFWCEILEALREEEQVVCSGAIFGREAGWIGEGRVSHIEEGSLVIHLVNKVADIAQAVIYTSDLVGRDVARLHEERIEKFLDWRWCTVADGGEGGHELGERGDGELEGGLAADEDLAGVGVGDEKGGGGDVLWAGDFATDFYRRFFEPGELGFGGGVDDGLWGASFLGDRFGITAVGARREVCIGRTADKDGDEEEAAPFEREGEALGVEGARWDVERVHGENDSMLKKVDVVHFSAKVYNCVNVRRNYFNRP